jgi:hypothetical protein
MDHTTKPNLQINTKGHQVDEQQRQVNGLVGILLK